MPGYSAKAQPFLNAIADGVFRSVDIRNRLIAGTPAELSYHNSDVLHNEPRAIRSKTTQPFWANHFCGRDGDCVCRVADSKALESDAIFFFRNALNRILAVHVEFKHDKEPFQFGQPEAYPLRAACFQKTAAQRKTVLTHDDWATILFCGQATLADSRVASFCRVITHSEALQFIPSYPTT
jgi:hypothetical protein